MSTKALCLCVTLFIKPERREEFLLVAEQNRVGTLANEPGAKLYTFGESTTTPNTFHFQEQFESMEAFEFHKSAPHFLIWEKFANDINSPFSQPPVFAQFFEH
jgi:quinol monooxygenase YgiN